MLVRQIYRKNVVFVTVWYFKYQPYLCNRCHDLVQKVIAYIKKSAYKIHFWYISKDDAINIMTNSNLVVKSGVLYLFLLYIKMSECSSVENTYLTYYQKNKDMVVSKAKDYYKNDKDRLRKQARDKYRNLSEEEKNKKREQARNEYKNLPEEEKYKKREYGKNRYHKMSEKKARLKEYQKKNTKKIITIRLKSLNK